MPTSTITGGAASERAISCRVSRRSDRMAGTRLGRRIAIARTRPPAAITGCPVCPSACRGADSPALTASSLLHGVSGAAAASTLVSPAISAPALSAGHSCLCGPAAGPSLLGRATQSWRKVI